MGSFIYMKKVTAVILTLSLLLCGILQPMPVNAENTAAEEKIYIRITAGNQEFSAVFYDNQTTQALLERFFTRISILPIVIHRWDISKIRTVLRKRWAQEL